MTTDSSSYAVRLRDNKEYWVAWSIAGVAASLAALFICQPSLVLVGLLIFLLLAAALRFDLVVYWFIFSLPWYPLFNLPVRDVYLLLRFVLFFGVWMLLRRKDRSVREWLLGGRVKKGVMLFVGISATSFFSSGIPADVSYLPRISASGLLCYGFLCR